MQVSFLALRNILKRVVPRWSRFIETSTFSVQSSRANANSYSDSLEPFVYAALRRRDLSKFWVSAKGIDDPENDLYHSPQVIYDEKEDDALIDFLRWNLDIRLKKSMPQVLRSVNRNFVTFGKAIVEHIYSQEQTPYGNFIVLDDLIDCDPRQFEIDPPNLKPGIYMKSRPSQRIFSEADRQPDIKFTVFTNSLLFDDRNGISELAVLGNIQADYENLWKDYRRGLEIAGRGLLLGKYSRELLGTQNKTKREEFLDELKEISSSTVSMCYEGNQIESIGIPLNHEAFDLGFRHTLTAISLVLTGKPDSLLETKFGSYNKEESMMREKSDIERLDCSVIHAGFNQSIIPKLLDLNYAQIDEYPKLQIIEPQLFQSTTPKDQDEQEQPDTTSPPPANTTQQQPSKLSLSSFLSLHGNLLNPAPDILETPAILDEGSRFLRRIAVKTAKDFDALPENEKRRTFTVHALKAEGREEVFRDLLAGINGTLSLLDHKDAFAAYRLYAKQMLRKHKVKSLDDSELMPSFMFARQLAFNQGILAESKKKDVTAFQYKTMEDDRVRGNHAALHNVVKSVNDTFWKTHMPPIDYNCRCSIKPLVGFYAPTPKEAIPETPVFEGR